MYALYLGNGGMRVVEASDGEQAIAIAKARLPDVITTGLELHDFSGMVLCQLLKGFAETKHIPVIAVTGNAMPHQVTAALAAGCCSVLLKPCPPDMLLSEIRRVLRPAETRSSESKPPTRVLWTLNDWRCELQEPQRLCLYRGDHLVADHVTSAHHVWDYARIWQAAVSEVFERTAKPPSR
jgi:CheY-like chemotaxis protein